MDAGGGEEGTAWSLGGGGGGVATGIAGGVAQAQVTNRTDAAARTFLGAADDGQLPMREAQFTRWTGA